MRSPCDPPKFDEQDWSQFDFTRWHLDGLAAGDATATALTELVQRLFGSPEWREHFAAGVPEVQRAARELYRQHAEDLRKEKADADRDFDVRTAAAEERAENYRRTVAASAEPPVVEPDPSTYRLAVKVVARAKNAGLDGLVVRIHDPQKDDLPLVEGVTDADGNAALSVPVERARELKDAHTTLSVRTVEGKPLTELKGALCIRLNQTETKVIRLPDSPEIEPHAAAAIERRTLREAQATSLAGRIERLKGEKGERLRDLDCRLSNTKALLAGFDHPPEPLVDDMSGRTVSKPGKTSRDATAAPAGEGDATAPTERDQARPEAPKPRPAATRKRRRKP